LDATTAHPIVPLVRDAVVEAVGGSLVGLYLYGSLATSDFEPYVSDIDLIAALTDAPDAPLVARLHRMHAGIAQADPEWDDRIEVDYVSTRGLAECRTRTTTIARISPGEPLHLLEAGRDFLLDWYPARRDGIPLVGPPIDSLIPPIPESEYCDEVRTYLAGFRARFDEDADVGSQAYAVLTMCRGFYSLTARERLSKRQAGLRVRQDFPRWDALIDRALDWRDRQWDPEQPDGSTSVAETRSFIDEMADRLDLP
jgi:Aminoglycoside adenylyltransferase, C-terminal domain